MSATTRPFPDRLALGLLMILMAAGSLALWTAVPGAALWVASLPDVSTAGHLLLTLGLVPLSILAFAAILMRLNALYVRIASSAAGEDRESFMRGPLEWLVIGSLIVAVIAMIVWTAFISGDPFPWTPPNA